MITAERLREVVWNRPPDINPIPHFAKSDPRNIDKAHARLAAIRTAEAVYRESLGLQPLKVPFRLPPAAARFYKAEAAKRNLNRDTLVRLLLLEIAAKPGLIDKILDDKEAAK